MEQGSSRGFLGLLPLRSDPMLVICTLMCTRLAWGRRCSGGVEPAQKKTSPNTAPLFLKSLLKSIVTPKFIVAAAQRPLNFLYSKTLIVYSPYLLGPYWGCMKRSGVAFWPSCAVVVPKLLCYPNLSRLLLKYLLIVGSELGSPYNGSCIVVDNSPFPSFFSPSFPFEASPAISQCHTEIAARHPWKMLMREVITMLSKWTLCR